MPLTTKFHKPSALSYAFNYNIPHMRRLKTVTLNIFMVFYIVVSCACAGNHKNRSWYTYSECGTAISLCLFVFWLLINWGIFLLVSGCNLEFEWRWKPARSTHSFGDLSFQVSFSFVSHRLRVAALGTGPNLLNLRLSRSQVTRPLAIYVPYISSAFSKIVWHHSFSSSFMTREFFTISLLRHSKSTLSGDDQWCYFTFLTTCPQGKLDMKIGCPV